MQPYPEGQKGNKQISKKPRVRFCWECGRQLWGNHCIEAMVNGNHTILHKDCFNHLKKFRENDSIITIEKIEGAQ